MSQPPLEAAIEVSATPARVWLAVSDFKAMRRRSPELIGMWLFGQPRVGQRSINLNRRKAFVWPTFGRITRWKDPAQDAGRGALAFHIAPTDVEWSYELKPIQGGTRITERRTALVDPPLAVRLTAKYALGGADGHDRELIAGMTRTLQAIKAEVEL